MIGCAAGQFERKRQISLGATLAAERPGELQSARLFDQHPDTAVGVATQRRRKRTCAVPSGPSNGQTEWFQRQQSALGRVSGYGQCGFTLQNIVACEARVILGGDKLYAFDCRRGGITLAGCLDQALELAGLDRKIGFAPQRPLADAVRRCVDATKLEHRRGTRFARRFPGQRLPEEREPRPPGDETPSLHGWLSGEACTAGAVAVEGCAARVERK